jgi:DNA-binding protein HU-beta
MLRCTLGTLPTTLISSAETLEQTRRSILTTMTKQQLIEQVASTTGQAKTDVERVFEALIEKASGALAAGDNVYFRGLGILEAKETKARTGRNPATGQASKYPPAGRPLSA